MRIIVTMTKELEDWWGVDDLLEDNTDAAEVMVADLTKTLIYRRARGRWRRRSATDRLRPCSSSASVSTPTGCLSRATG